MKAVQTIAIVVIVLMTANIVNVAINSGFDHGVGLDVFLAGRADPWQMLIDNDLVSGLLFSTAWIVMREKGGRAIATITWVWMILWWGNIVVAFYVLHAVREANGDWNRLLLDNRASGFVPAPAATAPLSPVLRVLCLAGAIVTAAFLVSRLAVAGLSAVAIVGYVAGFAPIVLAFALLAMRREAGRLRTAS